MRIATTVLTMTVLLACGLPECPAADPSGPPLLKVVGTHLTTPDGKVARLRGVNLPTLEWGQGENLFRSLDVAVDQWHVNFIRLTVSQDRWFGHTREKKDGGAHYRQTVHEFVKRAAAKRCYVLVGTGDRGGKLVPVLVRVCPVRLFNLIRMEWLRIVEEQPFLDEVQVVEAVAALTVIAVVVERCAGLRWAGRQLRYDRVHPFLQAAVTPEVASSTSWDRTLP
jgi:hypothetical protein